MKNETSDKENFTALKISELSMIVSRQTKINEAVARKALRAAISVLKERIEAIGVGERARVQGLGIFLRRPGKDDATPRIVFRAATKKSDGAEEKED